MDLSFDRMRRVLAVHRPREPLSFGLRSHAAVAALLRWTADAPEVLLMKRAARVGDRWSGHVSLPGGREAPEDPDLLATAIRETEEEVGLELRATATLLGRLDGVRAVARGRPLSMSITPYVFAQTRAGVVTLGDEAEAAFWLPLDRAASGALDDTYDYHLGPVKMALPCWRYDGQVIWGLTYQMLSNLLDVAGRAP
jgi:8-oxo-dGTP pyrophosphatase MutT (NUDIX family)